MLCTIGIYVIMTYIYVHICILHTLCMCFLIVVKICEQIFLQNYPNKYIHVCTVHTRTLVFMSCMIYIYDIYYIYMYTYMYTNAYSTYII